MKTFQINQRAIVAFCHDVLMTLLSCVLATLVLSSFNLFSASMNWLQNWPADLIPWLLIAIPVQALASTVLGMYQGLWRYAGLPDVQRIVASALVGTVLTAMVLWLGLGFGKLTFSHFFVQAMLLIVLTSGSRITYRTWKEWRLYGKSGEQGIPVLVLGAGDAAVGLVKELSRSNDWRVVGMLDDDTNKRHRVLHGARVLGRLDDLPKYSRLLKVKHAIIAMPSVNYGVRRRIVEICNKARVEVMTVPKFNDTSSSTYAGDAMQPPKIRRVAVEDLMKRESITLDDAGLHEFLSGKVIMVTGAGGSIGSELCAQIAAYQPSLLVLFDQNEFGLYGVEQALGDSFENLPIASVIGDIKNARRVSQVMHQYAPSLVFHAAAYKHVPLMEETNAWEAVQNNVLGTLVVAKAAIEFGVTKFVFISTDKAVNPTNVMGATKRLAEMICQALQQTTKTRFEMVRFGNVLGSAGSVIPRFQAQIEKGGPVTVTHPDMVRYFMSIPEAAQLVLQAGAMGLGGELFVLDMGEPVKIVDLANDMIHLSERQEEEIKIVYTGLRPGEKLFEELLAQDEHTRSTPHPKLRIAKAREVDTRIIASMNEWLIRESIPSDTEVRRELKRWVPEYVALVRPKLVAVSGGQQQA